MFITNFAGIVKGSATILKSLGLVISWGDVYVDTGDGDVADFKSGVVDLGWRAGWRRAGWSRAWFI